MVVVILDKDGEDSSDDKATTLPVSRTAYGQMIDITDGNSLLFGIDHYNYCIDSICDLNLVPNIPQPDDPNSEEGRKCYELEVYANDNLRKSLIAGRMKIYNHQKMFTKVFMKNHHVYTWQSAQRQ